MKISIRMILLFTLLLAAIGYTVYNWVTGTIDYNTAILYILVLCFPMIQALFAFAKYLKASQEYQHSRLSVGWESASGQFSCQARRVILR